MKGRRSKQCAYVSMVGLVTLLAAPWMARAEWTPIALPEHVEYLTALTAGSTYLYAAMADNAGSNLGVFRTPVMNPGTWESLGQAGRFIRKIVVAGPQDSYILVPGSGTTEIIGSTDGGMTWIARDAGIEDDQWILNLGWNGGFPGRVYASAGGESEPGSWIYFSTDFGASWSKWTLCDGCGMQVRYFATPQDAGPTSYAIATTGFFTAIPYKTVNGGANWQSIPAELWDGPIDLDVSGDARDLFMTSNSYLHWWRDDEVRHVLVPPPLGNQGATGAETPPWAPGYLFVSGVKPDGRLLVTYSRDPWTDWTVLDEGFPDEASPDPYWDTDKFQLASGRNAPRLYYSTWGLGLWVRNLENDLMAVEAGPRSTASGLALSLPWPNPTNEGTSFVLRPPPGQVARVDLLDCAGRLLCPLIGKSTGRGLTYTWDGRVGDASASSGMYFIRACSGRETVSLRVIVLD